MNFPLPPYRHVPGKNERHVESVFSQALGEIEKQQSIESLASSEVWSYAISLIENQYFWEAHEVLEAIWKCAQPNSSEACFLRGVIQVANFGLKQVMQKERAAKRLHQQALQSFDLAYRNQTNSKIMHYAKSDALELLQKVAPDH